LGRECIGRPKLRQSRKKKEPHSVGAERGSKSLYPTTMTVSAVTPTRRVRSVFGLRRRHKSSEVILAYQTDRYKVKQIKETI
jgi:hypothetical protein